MHLIKRFYLVVIIQLEQQQQNKIFASSRSDLFKGKFLLCWLSGIVLTFIYLRFWLNECSPLNENASF